MPRAMEMRRLKGKGNLALYFLLFLYASAMIMVCMSSYVMFLLNTSDNKLFGFIMENNNIQATNNGVVNLNIMINSKLSKSAKRPRLSMLTHYFPLSKGKNIINSSSIITNLTRKPETRKSVNFTLLFSELEKSPKVFCQNATFLGSVFVISAPTHFRFRSLIRETWGKSGHSEQLSLKTTFVLGHTPNEDTQTAVDLESNTYGDILQVNFPDNYRNLTYKTMYCLYFVLKYCPRTKFVIKIDDDLFVNVFGLARFLRRIDADSSRPSENTLFCFVNKNRLVIRNKRSHYYASVDDYRQNVYPPYCSGGAYIIPVNVLPKLYDAATRIPFFYIEDVFLTGLAAKNGSVKHRSISYLYTFSFQAFAKQMERREVLFGFFHHREMYRLRVLWKNTEAIETNLYV